MSSLLLSNLISSSPKRASGLQLDLFFVKKVTAPSPKDFGRRFYSNLLTIKYALS
jgi:hypothetical protein